MIEHKKVSGVANTDPGKVGGDDWDENHVFPVGAVFLYGYVHLVFSGVDGWVSVASYTVSETISYASGAGSKFRLTMTIDVSRLPIRAGALWTPRVVFEYLSDSYQARRFVIESFNQNTGQLVFILDNIAGTGTGSFSSMTHAKASVNIEVTG